MWETVKTALNKGLEAIADAPVSGVIKAGMLIGVAGFTAWVLIKNAKNQLKHSDDDEYQHRSPVDEILGKANYAGSADDFDELDPASKKLFKRFNSAKRYKKRRRKGHRDEPKTRVVSLFDEDAGYSTGADDLFFESSSKRRKPKGYGDRPGDDLRRVMRNLNLGGFNRSDLEAKADRAARDLGLSITRDDDVDEDTRRANPSLF